MAAYDDYRGQSDHQTGYSTSPRDSNYDSRPYPTASYHQNSHYQDQTGPRSRASSNAPSDNLHQPAAQQPLNSALNNAFDNSDSARTVDPDLIAQITAEVKRSVLDEIKLNGMGGATVQPQPSAPPPHYIPQSPASTSASFPSRNVYTPPSPNRPGHSSQGSASPDPLAHDPMFDGAADTPTPRYERTAPADIHTEGAPRPRPAPAPRMATDVDFTPIEKMWQRLFTPEGEPTPRLGQFLRGLAMHLIDDYEPKKSLVISPAKMLKFYDDVKLSDEIYPWNSIFGKLPYATLSKLYREMRCQHHLVQEHIADQPHIPALTPEGFEEWMTAMIQAYPDTEYERLSKAVLVMPISNADDIKERFPKELPRRLFPQKENLHAQQRCAAILAAEGVGPLRRAPTFPPPPPMAQSTGPAPNLERERSPYVSQPYSGDSRAVESDDEGNEPLAIPIERERKPYSAAPGGGKIYEHDSGRNMQPDTSLPDHRKRAQSAAGQSGWVPPNASHQQQHPRTYSTTQGRRPKSPSFSNYGTRSDPNVQNIPGYYPPSVHDPEEESRRFAKEAEFKRNDWARRQAEDDAAGRPPRRSTGLSDGSHDAQSRSVYDDDYYRDRGRSNTTNGYDNRGYEPRRY